MTAPWRVGSKVPLNVYEGDRPVCQCHSALDAHVIVRAMNRFRMPVDTNPTPGPWHRDPEMPTMILDAPLAQAKEIIAQTSGLANARLIAAAPQLLEVIKGAVNHCVGWRAFQEDELSVPLFVKVLEDEFRAAIALAEGRDA